MSKGTDGHIRVVCRLRPLNSLELSKGGQSCVNFNEKNIKVKVAALIIINQNEKKKQSLKTIIFTFKIRLLGTKQTMNFPLIESLGQKLNKAMFLSMLPGQSLIVNNIVKNTFENKGNEKTIEK